MYRVFPSRVHEHASTFKLTPNPDERRNRKLELAGKMSRTGIITTYLVLRLVVRRGFLDIYLVGAYRLLYGFGYGTHQMLTPEAENSGSIVSWQS